MTTLKRLCIFLACVFVVIGCYESWRVIEARAVTPALMQSIKSTASPKAKQLKANHKNILITVEDPTFWTNDGIDLKTPGQGLTTLTQALAKQIYFDRFTPGLRKLELILISKFALTSLVTKDEILTAFLSVAYMGRDETGSIIGFSEASQRWYGKTLSNLTDDEFTALVAMLIAPDALNPKTHPRENQDRVDRIKRLVSGACVPTGLLDVNLAGCA